MARKSDRTSEPNGITRRKEIPEKDVKLLFSRAGNICAFPGCSQPLTISATSDDDDAVIGEIAHIIADRRQGPRGRASLLDEDRNKYPNLILLCRNHHRTIDSQANTFSVPVLKQMKADHEERVRKLLQTESPATPRNFVDEVIQSTILSVTHLPEFVFRAPCSFNESQKRAVQENIDYQSAKGVLLPFVLHGNQLLSFYDLRKPSHPFSRVVEGEAKDVEVVKVRDLWQQDDGARLFQMLMNRALYKLTARQGIRYDPIHKRFYFAANANREERSVQYRSLTGRKINRKVAWCPVRRSTGEARNFWWHWAAGLKFHQLSELQWCLSIRPERHITKDGEEPFPSELIGRKVTSLKARMYNPAYLKEIHFWRDYLSAGSSSIVFNFGSQSAVVSAEITSVNVSWPGVPGDVADMPKRSVEEDLFSYAELATAIGGEESDSESDEEFYGDGAEVEL